MKKTKAGLRALREECGLTQQDLADLVDVRVLTVKKWENPNSDIKAAPDDVWERLLSMRAAMIDEAWAYSDKVCELARTAGEEEIVVFYYRTQEMLDKRSDNHRPFRYVNAVTRKAADLIQANGFQVTYLYAGEEAEFAFEPDKIF